MSFRSSVSTHYRHHLAATSEADTHFRAVCRALVTEAVELTTFMEKVSGSKSQVETDSELGQLDIQDWARLWVQVIHELRSGVRLKKTEYTRTPIEYELTPYEILMDDIRSKRYKLNKVTVRTGQFILDPIRASLSPRYLGDGGGSVAPESQARCP